MLLPDWVVKVLFCHSFQWEAIVPVGDNGEERLVTVFVLHCFQPVS